MKALLAALLFVTVSAFGQSLRIGTTYSGDPDSNDLDIGPARTDVSLQPASANGTIDTVHVHWAGPFCANALKLKFFHRVGDTLTLIEERGPFATTGSDLTYPLLPPVTVEQGDLIGVTRVGCGSATTRLPDAFEPGYVEFPDITGSADLSTGTNVATSLMLYGTGNATSYLGGVLTVAGSLTGAFGSEFRTQVQLLNPSPIPASGTLVFHPAGTPGSSADPSMSYTLAPGRVAFFNDIVATMGQTGLGSIDFVVPADQNPPLAFTRVYNDAGAAGTVSLTEDLIGTNGDDRVLTRTGFLISPLDPAQSRFNIGIRTLSQGATLTATLQDDGLFPTTIATVTKTYPPNWFEQPSASDFFGVPVGGSFPIQINVTAGSAIIYGSTTDNTTNDPAVQFMTARAEFADPGGSTSTSLPKRGNEGALYGNNRVMAVAGAASGAFGSQFHTVVQLYNPSPKAINGTLVFHPAGTPGSPADLTLPYLLLIGRVTVLDDLAFPFGQTRLGSVDFIVTPAQSAPITVARVYNDAGAAGTTGLSEDLIGPAGDPRVLYGGYSGFLVTPPDPTKVRFNLGIRTLDPGATLTATLRDGTTGATLAAFTRTYPPNVFEQTLASDFFGIPIGGNNVIQISVVGADDEVIVYGSTTDNTSNDPALQFMTRTFAEP